MEHNSIFEFYRVGGCVRDFYLNRACSDIDYTVVYIDDNGSKKDISAIFELLCQYLKDQQYQIYQINTKCLTIRAKFPPNMSQGLVADFVLARREIYPDENSRLCQTCIGTLQDDMFRRDFTINAMAIDSNGTLIDLTDGMHDLQQRLLRTPVNASTTLLQDPLRVLRGLRFSIQLQFDLDVDFFRALENPLIWTKMKRVVSADRIRQELNYMFECNVVQTLQLFEKITQIYPRFYDIVFEHIKICAKVCHVEK